MKKLYLLCGIQGAGKSTYSKKHKEILQSEVISTDYIRINYKPIEEKDVFPMAYKLIAENIKKGKNVIFDATSINVEARKQHLDGILPLIDRKQVEIVCICFKVDKELCKKRVEKRNQLEGEIFLPLEVIDNFDQRFQEPTLEEGFDEIIFVK